MELQPVEDSHYHSVYHGLVGSKHHCDLVAKGVATMMFPKAVPQPVSKRPTLGLLTYVPLLQFPEEPRATCHSGEQILVEDK